MSHVTVGRGVSLTQDTSSRELGTFGWLAVDPRLGFITRVIISSPPKNKQKNEVAIFKILLFFHLWRAGCLGWAQLINSH